MIEWKFVGESIYMSQVDKILKKNGYRPSNPFDPNQKVHMIIKADSFYCDNEVRILIAGLR